VQEERQRVEDMTLADASGHAAIVIRDLRKTFAAPWGGRWAVRCPPSGPCALGAGLLARVTLVGLKAQCASSDEYFWC
jgi:hypothetical protein